MKKTIGIIVLALFILPTFVSAGFVDDLRESLFGWASGRSSSRICEDTEDGPNSEIAGELTYTYRGRTTERLDKCVTRRKKSYVKDYYCDSRNRVRSKTIRCTQGCEDGACISEDPEPICQIGIVECRNSDLYKCLGNKWDLKEKNAEQCGYVECEDSDGGVDVYKRGKTTGTLLYGPRDTYSDACFNSDNTLTVLNGKTGTIQIDGMAHKVEVFKIDEKETGLIVDGTKFYVKHSQTVPGEDDTWFFISNIVSQGARKHVTFWVNKGNSNFDNVREFSCNEDDKVVYFDQQCRGNCFEGRCTLFAKYPDLIMLDAIDVEDTYSKFTISNIGEVGVDQPFKVSVKISSREVCTEVVERLAVNERKILSCEYEFSVGSYDMEFIADSTELIKERNEKNNQEREILVIEDDTGKRPTGWIQDPTLYRGAPKRILLRVHDPDGDLLPFAFVGIEQSQGDWWTQSGENWDTMTCITKDICPLIGKCVKSCVKDGNNDTLFEYTYTIPEDFADIVTLTFTFSDKVGFGKYYRVRSRVIEPPKGKVDFAVGDPITKPVVDIMGMLEFRVANKGGIMAPETIAHVTVNGNVLCSKNVPKMGPATSLPMTCKIAPLKRGYNQIQLSIDPEFKTDEIREDNNFHFFNWFVTGCEDYDTGCRDHIGNYLNKQFGTDILLRFRCGSDPKGIEMCVSEYSQLEAAGSEPEPI